MGFVPVFTSCYVSRDIELRDTVCMFSESQVFLTILLQIIVQFVGVNSILLGENTINIADNLKNKWI